MFVPVVEPELPLLAERGHREVRPQHKAESAATPTAIRPLGSELQPNDRANIAAKAIQVVFETERIAEQEALPICIGRIFADLPIRFPEDRAKGLLEFVADSALNRLGAPAGQFIQFPIAFVRTRDI